ncbi:hypothetical protein G9A89_003676 [Geosiphon pyriformis]|nr:hypothetical protein G9A89_003676 [Geosiphon pyriformis]
MMAMVRKPLSLSKFLILVLVGFSGGGVNGQINFSQTFPATVSTPKLIGQNDNVISTTMDPIISSSPSTSSIPTRTPSTTGSPSSESASVISPGGRFGHCSVTYKNTFYVFGGWDENTNTETGINFSPNFFYSTTLPINSNAPTWRILTTQNATSVGSAACVVTPTGYLLVLGGVISLKVNEDKVSTQVFDLNREVWIDWKTLMVVTYPGFGINPKAVLLTPNFVSVYAGNTGVNEDGKRFPIQIIYFLNMTTIPWTWSEARKSESINAPISRIIIPAKGDAWQLGGYFPNKSDPDLGTSREIYVSNRRNKWVSPDIKLPYGVRDGAAGVRNNLIFYLVYNGRAGYPPVNVFPVDMATLQLQPNISFTGMTPRSGASFAQFSGSDAFLIYGGCPLQNMSPACGNTLDTLQVFNMTLRNFTQEHKIITNIHSNDFKLPKINNLDMNAENDELDPNIRNQEIGIFGEQSNRDQVSSKSRLPTWLIVFISVLVTAIAISLIFFGLWLCRNRTLGPLASFEITQPPISPRGPIPTTDQTFSTRPHPLTLYSIPNMQSGEESSYRGSDFTSDHGFDSPRRQTKSDEFEPDDDDVAVIGEATHVHIQPSPRIPVIVHPIERGNNSDMVELFENWNLSGGNFTTATGGPIQDSANHRKHMLVWIASPLDQSKDPDTLLPHTIRMRYSTIAVKQKCACHGEHKTWTAFLPYTIRIARISDHFSSRMCAQMSDQNTVALANCECMTDMTLHPPLSVMILTFNSGSKAQRLEHRLLGLVASRKEEENYSSVESDSGEGVDRVKKSKVVD